MDNELKRKVLDKIKEIYPDISDDDIVVLFGSRAKGYHVKDSDIDIEIFTDNYEYFRKMCVEKGLRKPGEDAGFEIRLDNGILLETKFLRLIVPKFDVTLYHDLTTAKPLTSISKFKAFQNEIRKEFMRNYEDLLFHTYVQFFKEFKTLEGISKRKDVLSKINLSIKKGIVIQGLLRLIIVMEKKPYTFEKYLAHEAAKTKHWKKVSGFIKLISNVDSFEEYTKMKVIVRDYIDSAMPKRAYVGNWWKYLNKHNKS
jgi:predicted nucleotidyltransferase